MRELGCCTLADNCFQCVHSSLGERMPNARIEAATSRATTIALKTAQPACTATNAERTPTSLSVEPHT